MYHVTTRALDQGGVEPRLAVSLRSEGHRQYHYTTAPANQKPPGQAPRCTGPEATNKENTRDFKDRSRYALTYMEMPTPIAVAVREALFTSSGLTNSTCRGVQSSLQCTAPLCSLSLGSTLPFWIVSALSTKCAC